jgi:hypothetical protein
VRLFMYDILPRYLWFTARETTLLFWKPDLIGSVATSTPTRSRALQLTAFSKPHHPCEDWINRVASINNELITGFMSVNEW